MGCRPVFGSKGRNHAGLKKTVSQIIKREQRAKLTTVVHLQSYLVWYRKQYIVKTGNRAGVSFQETVDSSSTYLFTQIQEVSQPLRKALRLKFVKSQYCGRRYHAHFFGNGKSETCNITVTLLWSRSNSFKYMKVMSGYLFFFFRLITQ